MYSRQEAFRFHADIRKNVFVYECDSVSCIVRNCFLSVGSQYGTNNGMQDVKVWHQGCRVAVIF